MTTTPPSLFDPPVTAPVPPVPNSLRDTGLSADQLEQLVVKTLSGGAATRLTIADRLRLPWMILAPLVERARAGGWLDAAGPAGVGGKRFALTDAGQDRARQYFEASQYVGPAPVPLASYVSQMSATAGARRHVDYERLRQGFSHLVVRDSLLEQLGSALNAGKAILLYGPPGNGKTAIAEGLGRTLDGDMYVPHAIDVDGHTVTLFDPLVHDSLEADPDTSGVTAAALRDDRWVRVRSPVVTVGSELTLDMLDLTFNPVARFSDAPIQLKANGGVFLVDDFGRQRIRPRDLLNRWIAPLESRVDHLALHTGKTFRVPFEMLSVFATNLNPESLVDEAFLRRIPHKIAIGDPSMEEFTRIFELNCRRLGLRFHKVMVDYLQRRHYEGACRPLRACHPRDLLDHVTALCRLRGIEPALTRELLDAACASYFVAPDPAAPSTPASRRTVRRRLEVH